MSQDTNAKVLTPANLRDRMVTDILDASRERASWARGPFEGLGLGHDPEAVTAQAVELRRAQYAVGAKILRALAELLQLETEPELRTLRGVSVATYVVCSGMNDNWQADLDQLDPLDHT